MKKIIVCLLTFVLATGLASNGFASETSDYENDQIFEEQESAASVNPDEDLSGKVFTEVFGDGSDYQVTAVQFTEDDSAIEVSYIANSDCDLRLAVYDEIDNSIQAEQTVAAEAGNNTVQITFDDNSLPEHYWVEAVLLGNGEAISDVFSNCERTVAFQDFLTVTAEDEEYQDNVVLDYGEDENGEDNFAVVNPDVKVIYVESIEETAVLSSAESDAVIGLVDDFDGYIFTEVINEEVMDTLESGDRILIYPMDDINEARVMSIDTIEETAVLNSEGDPEEAVEVTAADDEDDLSNYFEFIRLNVVAEADTEDLDTSDHDEDVEFIDEVIVDEADEEDEVAQLQANKTANASVGKGASVTAQIQNSAKTVTVKDTVSVYAKVTFSINYNATLGIPTKLNSITVSSDVTVKNVFDFKATRSASYNPNPKKLGTIALGTVAGVTFSLPIYLTFSASFNASFHYNSTKTDTSYLKAVYSSGKFSVATSKSSTYSRSIETEAKAVISLGVKCCLQASFLKVITLSLNGEVGLQLTLTAQSVNSTSTYRHTCSACLTAALDVYLVPSFELKLVKKTLASKTWSKSTQRIATFYVSKKGGKYTAGAGECPNRQYYVTITVNNNRKKPLQNVAIKEGSSSLGSTDKNGKKGLWMSMKSHVLKFTLRGYNTGTLSFTVSGASNKAITLYPSGANEYFYSMDELLGRTDEEWNSFISDEALVANTIFQITNAEDLEKLSEFSLRSDRTTKNLRFLCNNESGIINLNSEEAWTPIGNEENPFKGEFDGNGFTINYLSVNTTDDYSGLFGNVDGAVIHDLMINQASIHGHSHVGILAGNAGEKSNIYDIAVNGGFVEGEDYVGGILGGMNQTILRNSYNTAEITGRQFVGGITGEFSCSEKSGIIENCYSTGMMTATDDIGGICGKITLVEAADSGDEEPGEEPGEDSEEESVDEAGIRYAYYLDAAAESAVAEEPEGLEILAYAITEEQGTGEDADGKIDEAYGYANAETLLEALNNWYVDNGVYKTEDEEESGEEPSEEGEVSGEETIVPDSNVNDFYNHWYEDSKDGGDFTNEGYPIFAEKEKVYKLSVQYVYEDGAEAFPPVTLYLTEGQAYDVDSYHIDGYHTNEEEYKGNMPANDLDYRVIYVADKPYTSMTELAEASQEASPGSKYSISNEEELILLSNYTSAGNNTAGVSFIQLAPIEMNTNTSFVSIGTGDLPFKGIYDGQYLGIENLSTSIFGAISEAEIKNLAVDTVISAGSQNNVGGVANYAENSSLSGCVVNAQITGNAVNCGGLIGKGEGCTIDNCSVSGSIRGAVTAGGISGSLSSSTVSDSYNASQVSGSEIAGGLIGSLEDQSSVINCYNTGAVECTLVAGGISGDISDSIIHNVYQSGTVTGGTAGSITGTADNCPAESVYYLNGQESNIEGALLVSYDEAGIDTLLGKLNQWVSLQNSKQYLSWSKPVASEEEPTDGEESGQPEDSELGTPVFGEEYVNWITDLHIDDGYLSFIFDKEYYPDGTAYLAIYTEQGKMILISSITESADRQKVSDDAKYATAYIVSENFEPLSEAVVSN